MARIHGGVADVVNYEWQRVLLGISSAHPHALQHGAVVEVGHVDASVGACATLNNMCLERWARRHLYDCRSHEKVLGSCQRRQLCQHGGERLLQPRQPDVLWAGGFCGTTSIAILADLLGLDYVVGGRFRRANRHE